MRDVDLFTYWNAFICTGTHLIGHGEKFSLMNILTKHCSSNVYSVPDFLQCNGLIIVSLNVILAVLVPIKGTHQEKKDKVRRKLYRGEHSGICQ